MKRPTSDLIGADWLRVVRAPDVASFAAFLAPNAVLEASVLPGLLLGAEAIYAFFSATRTMYDTISFVAETKGDRVTYLEWEGVFRGHRVSGVTSLKYNAEQLLLHITVNHRPYEQVVSFAEALLPAVRAHLVERTTP